MASDLEVAVLTAVFRARPDGESELAAVLARYVVLTRRAPGCRNVDLLTSATESGRFLVIEKWDSADAARAHLDTELMSEMAEAAVPLLAGRPEIDLLDTISAHDLM
jgi:quinol monooxygenase YgiN